ncbi:MAG: cytochrome c [Betaproteobacteria bacterium]|nr:cytochrome c [Betaproteobacteria bacterium]
MKRSIALSLAALVAALAAPAAQAQFAKASDAIKYRQSGMWILATHFGRIGAMVNGKVAFDAKTAADNAAIVAYMSKLPFAGFVEGSDKGETKAKAKIWTERVKFDQDRDNMQAAAAKLASTAAAPGLTLDQLKAAFGETAKTCKACHDAFREE